MTAGQMNIQPLKTRYLCPSDDVKSTIENYLYVWLLFMASKVLARNLTLTIQVCSFKPGLSVYRGYIYLYPKGYSCSEFGSESYCALPYLCHRHSGAIFFTSDSHVPLVVLGAGVTGLTIAHLATCDPDVTRSLQETCLRLSFSSLGSNWSLGATDKRV